MILKTSCCEHRSLSGAAAQLSCLCPQDHMWTSCGMSQLLLVLVLLRAEVIWMPSNLVLILSSSSEGLGGPGKECVSLPLACLPV